MYVERIHINYTNSSSNKINCDTVRGYITLIVTLYVDGYHIIYTNTGSHNINYEKVGGKK
jgi:hypothetical protein